MAGDIAGSRVGGGTSVRFVSVTGTACSPSTMGTGVSPPGVRGVGSSLPGDTVVGSSLPGVMGVGSSPPMVIGVGSSPPDVMGVGSSPPGVPPATYPRFPTSHLFPPLPFDNLLPLIGDDADLKVGEFRTK